jgi:hypothetical protein
MFQNTPRANSFERSDPQTQEQQKREQQAHDAVTEAQRRMMSDAQLRSLELQRQTIEGRVEDVRAKERQGASAQQVADKAKENTIGSLDFDLGRLTPPSLNEDTRGEIRLAYMRAVDVQAKELETRQVEQQEKIRGEDRSLVGRERRDREVVLDS